MAEVGSVWVGLNVDVSGAGKFTTAANVIGRDSQRMRAGLAGTTRSIASLQAQMGRTQRMRLFGDSIRTIARTNDEMSRLRATMVGISALSGTGLTGAMSASYLLQTADRARLLSNQLKTVTKDSADLTATQEQLYLMSQRTRSSFDATTKIYARTARATDHLGLSQEKLLKITETVQKAFAIGGATQQEAMGAAIQLSQGIASDRFSGEEFRSVSENAPVLLKGIAASLGVNIGKLREMAHAGKLTAKVVTESILKAAGDIDVAFDKTVATVGQSITRLDNAFLMYIGQADESYGVTRKLSGAITGLAENFEEVAKWAGVALAAGASLLGARAASGAVGRRVESFQEIRIARQAELDVLREQSREMSTQAALIPKQIALHQQKAAAASAAATAEGATTKQIIAGQRAQAREFQRIEKLRERQIALGTQQVAVTNQIAAATRRANAAAALGTMARNAGAGVLGFFGGWTGVAFMAAIAGLLMWQKQSMKAAEDTERLIKKLRDLGYVSVEAGNEMESLADKIAKGRWAALLKDIEAATSEIEKARNALAGITITGIEDEIAGLDGFTVEAPVVRMMRELRRQFLGGEIDAAEFTEKLDEIARQDSRVAKLATEFQKLAEIIQGAAKYVDDLNKGLAEAGRKPSFRAAERGSLDALDAMRGENSKFFADRMTDAQRTEFDKEVSKRAEDILKAAEKLGNAISKTEASFQAREEILAERNASDLDGAVSGFVNRVVAAESGGDRFAKNRDSTATGLGQFIESTWLDLFKRHFPDRAKGMTDAAILEMRKESAESKLLIDAYARENAAVLQRAGLSVNEAALHLSHFLGAGDAAKVLSAAPGTPLAGLISPASIAANPTILGGGKTVDDAVAYAQKRAGMTTELTKEIDLREQQNLTIQQTMESLRQQAEMYGLEAATLNMSTFNRERLLKALELEQQFKAQGIAITPELIALIDAEADAYARATARADEYVLAQQLLAEQTQFARDVTGNFISDLTQGLRSGEDEWESFANAAVNALSKIADTLMNEVLDAIFQVNKAGSGLGGGGGGFLSKLFGGLFGGGGGGLNYAALGATGKYLFDSGGHLGANVVPFGPNTRRIGAGWLADSGLGAQHFPAILKKGETVLTEADTNRAMAAINGLAEARTGGSSHVTVGVSVDENGNLQAYVMDIAKSASRGALQEYDRGNTQRVAAGYNEATRRRMIK